VAFQGDFHFTKESCLNAKGPAGQKTTQRAVEILLVEDNPGDVALFKEALKPSRFTLRLSVVPDGEEAMRYLRREAPYGNASKPDLILLDLNLPRKDGHEVLAEIRRTSRFSGIPALILTGSNTDEDKWKAYRSRADAYLLKPQDLSHLKALLRYLEENWLKDIQLALSNESRHEGR
jgi:chemotaxis family two-component system response regulator Rcp1